MIAVKGKKGGGKDKGAKQRAKLQAKREALMAKIEANKAASSTAPNYSDTSSVKGSGGNSSTPVKTAKDCSGVKCGDSFEVGAFQSKKAGTGSNKKRLSNVGSSKEWKRNKKLQEQLEKVNEELKKNKRPSNRVANPRFL
jgi:hypothetical protein